jgi:hypothetical protein
MAFIATDGDGNRCVASIGAGIDRECEAARGSFSSLNSASSNPAHIIVHPLLWPSSFARDCAVKRALVKTNC